jgi:ABC-type cobalamin/Fe3+-siderophores transport system ATPase subunit
LLRYFGELLGMDSTAISRRMEALIDWLDIGSFADLRCGGLSTGQKQRTNIARALMGDPPILVMDEPTLGLDVLTNRVVLDFIRAEGQRGKAIIILNPAEPPLMMRDTVHCITTNEPDRAAITESVKAMETEVQKYVPGYRVKEGPVFDGNRVSIFLQVQGRGDYLPEYAGNLDIMTAAAARTAEIFAEQMLAGEVVA